MEEAWGRFVDRGGPRVVVGSLLLVVVGSHLLAVVDSLLLVEGIPLLHHEGCNHDSVGNLGDDPLVDDLPFVDYILQELGCILGYMLVHLPKIEFA